MNLEDYFDFNRADNIRIKGTRVDIETVLEDYLEGMSPEEIAVRYHPLSLEQVYATVTYYWHNREQIDNYLIGWRQFTDKAAQQQDRYPPEVVKRLRQLKELQLVEASGDRKNRRFYFLFV